MALQTVFNAFHSLFNTEVLLFSANLLLCFTILPPGTLFLPQSLLNLTFKQCLLAHGYVWVPHPGADGRDAALLNVPLEWPWFVVQADPAMFPVCASEPLVFRLLQGWFY